jgi:glycosyltransferase involved in cell wall biosynthesis
MPLVSVIIPAYNAEKYIGEAVRSVVMQAFADIEIIVVDDGSTDGTVEAVRPYTDNVAVRIIRQDNSGPSKARNKGIRAARGEYCAFLDSDDLMMPDRLRLQADLLKERKDIGLVYTDLMTFDAMGIVHRSKKEFATPHAGTVLDKLLIENFITTSTVMVRTDCFEEAGYFDEGIKHSEDYKMWLHIAEKYAVGYVDLPLVKYRYHPNSLSEDRVIINSSAYNVVQSYWKEHQEYKRRNSVLYRRSMASQLTRLGNAYYLCGENSMARKCLVKAVRLYPFLKQTYRILLKQVVKPSRRTASKKLTALS